MCKECVFVFSFYFLEWPRVYVLTDSEALNDTCHIYVREGIL